MENKVSNNLKENLAEIFSGKASDDRINDLLKNLMSVIENTDEKLDEVLFFVDEFEGGASTRETFERVFLLVLRNLPVNKQNAQRLFDFFQHCRNMDVYAYLIGDFCDFLTDEQKSELPLTCPFFYAGRP